MKNSIHALMALSVLVTGCKDNDAASKTTWREIKVYAIGDRKCPDVPTETSEVFNGIPLENVVITDAPEEGNKTIVTKSGFRFWAKNSSLNLRRLGFRDSNSLIADLRSGTIPASSPNYMAVFGPGTTIGYSLSDDFLTISSSSQSDDFILVISLADEAVIWLNAEEQLDSVGDEVIRCELGL